MGDRRILTDQETDIKDKLGIDICPVSPKDKGEHEYEDSKFYRMIEDRIQKEYNSILNDKSDPQIDIEDLLIRAGEVHNELWSDITRAGIGMDMPKEEFADLLTKNDSKYCEIKEIITENH